MSDTPRTDEAEFHTGAGMRVTSTFARQLERELDAANERIKRLEEKVKDMESARTQAAANSLANMLAYEDATKKIDALIKEGDKAKRAAARYKVVRRMNHIEFAELIQRCVRQDIRFDDMVDRIGGIK